MTTNSTNIKWAAGWNIPGCLPDIEPAIFDSEGEALVFISEEYQRVVADHGKVFADDYHYWVEAVEG